MPVLISETAAAAVRAGVAKLIVPDIHPRVKRRRQPGCCKRSNGNEGKKQS